jgi:hypothetical protein
MKIELLYFSSCPNHAQARALVEETVRKRSVPAELVLTEVSSPEEATERHFLGSPTIRVNDVDIDPTARSSDDFGLKCRLYHDGNHLTGVPPRELLERALSEASDSRTNEIRPL